MKKFTGFLAVACLAATPATATVREAAFASASDQANARTSLFVGASYSVGFDRTTNRTQGRASLKMSGMRLSPGTAELRFGQGLEIATRGAGRPMFLVGGSDLGEVRKSAKLKAGTTVLIVVGVAALAAGIYVAALYAEDARKNVE